jgi:hypothetical protein
MDLEGSRRLRRCDNRSAKTGVLVVVLEPSRHLADGFQAVLPTRLGIIGLRSHDN